jgi:hypothetical protein
VVGIGKLAATPGGNPLAPGTPLSEISEAEVEIVISVNGVFIQSVGVLDGAETIHWLTPLNVTITIRERINNRFIMNLLIIINLTSL